MNKEELFESIRKSTKHNSALQLIDHIEIKIVEEVVADEVMRDHLLTLVLEYTYGIPQDSSLKIRDLEERAGNILRRVGIK